jgi:hypothetical protein
VDDPSAVQILKAGEDITQLNRKLRREYLSVALTSYEKPTNAERTASGFRRRDSRTFPFGIRRVTIPQVYPNMSSPYPTIRQTFACPSVSNLIAVLKNF